MRKRIPSLLLTGVIGVSAGLTPAPIASAFLPAAVQADPALGPHAREEARHALDHLAFAPARASIPPRRSTRAAAVTGPAATGLTPAAGTLSREVFGFAPYWTLARESGWNYTLLSTVAYFGLTMNGDGTFVTTDNGYAGFGSADFSDMVTRAHAAGDRVAVVIKAFNSDTICSIVYNAAQAAITNTISAITSKHLDGVNVDFEGSNVTCGNSQSLQPGMTAFVSSLSTQLHNAVPGSMVTLDTYSGAASWDSGIFKIDDLARTPLEAMFVMAYDMNFSNNGYNHAGPTAPLNGWTYNDTLSVQQYLTKAPASKVILGVPYYGYKWCTVDRSAYSQAVYGPTSGKCPDNATNNPTAAGYAQLGFDLSCQGDVNKFSGLLWDSAASSSWASWWSPGMGDPCGGNHNSWREAYYDDATSLGLKYDLVNASNLRGTGMWALGMDSPSGDLWSELSLKFVSRWASLGGRLTSGPDASGTSGKETVVVRGTDNALWYQTFDGTAWSGWKGLGGAVTSGPAVIATPGTTQLDVFARGTDLALWHRSFDGTAWKNWESLGGRLTSAPDASSWGTGRLDVFALGSDAALWHRSFDGTTWGAWDSLGGRITADPTAVSWGPDRIDAFVRGTDNALYHRAYVGGTWLPWEYRGGQLTSAPDAAASTLNRLELVARGGDNAVWRLAWDGTRWLPWQSLGGQASGAPAIAAPATGSLDVFVPGTDAGLWHKAITIY